MISYTAAPTLARFHRGSGFARAIVGPLGSGKSTGCTLELWRLANDPTSAGHDGMIRSRILVARNSYRELRDTTLATFRHWIPENIGVFSRQDFTLELKSGRVECEFLFRSFDTPEDMRKLLSIELTHAWLNEARELARPVFDMLTGRLGRFPPRAWGPPVTPRLILDSNPSDRMHWLYRTFAEDPPEGYELYIQPSGLAPEAENLENLPDGYYDRISKGKSEDWINVYVRGQWGYARDGLPIFPEFTDRAHVAPAPLVAEPQTGALIVGLDFGLTPAAVILQRRASGGYNALCEVVTERAGVQQFAPLVLEEMKAFPWCREWRIWGDPAGRYGSSNDMQSCYDVLAGAGLEAHPVMTGGNALSWRRESVGRLLKTLCSDGYPALYFSPACRVLIIGMGGAYRFRRLSTSGAEMRYSEEPDKNHPYSDICDALGYGVLGEGEGYELRGETQQLPIDYSRTRRATAAYRR